MLVIVCLFLVSGACFETPVFAQAEGSAAVVIPEKEIDYVIAEIGPRKVYFSEVNIITQKFNRFLKENFETSQSWRLNFIRQYVAQVALAEMAEKKGIAEDKDVTRDIKKATQGILAEKLVTNKLAQITISEANIQDYYQQNKDAYQIKEKIKVNYIKPKNQKDAEKMLVKLNKGQSFEKVGGRKIVKVDSWMSEGMPSSPELEGLKPEDKKALFALSPGANSPILKNSAGEPLIICIKEKQAAEDRPFEEVRRQVESELARKINEKVVTDLVKEAFENEKVTIHDAIIIENMPKNKKSVE